MTCMQLNSIKSCLFYSSCTGAKLFHNSVNIRLGQFPRQFTAPRTRNSAGCDRLNSTIHSGMALSSSMINLCKNLCPILMNPFCQFPVRGNLVVIIQTGDIFISHTMGIDAIIFRNDQSPSTFGFFFMITNIPFRGFPFVITIVCYHCRNHKAVFYFAVTNFSFVKQSIKHFSFSSLSAFSFYAYNKCRSNYGVNRKM